MAVIISGVYKQGKIELLETPTGIREGPVRIVLLGEVETKPAPRLLEFGKYQTGMPSTPEDFQTAEWHGEDEFDGR